MYLKAILILTAIFVGMNCYAEPLVAYDGFVANLDEKTKKKCQNPSGPLNSADVEVLAESAKDYQNNKKMQDLSYAIYSGLRKQCSKTWARKINVIGRVKNTEPYVVFFRGVAKYPSSYFTWTKKYSLKYSRYSKQTCERKPGSPKIKKHESILKLEKLTGVIFGRPFYGDPATKGKPSYYAEVVKVCPNSAFVRSGGKKGDLVSTIFIGGKEAKIGEVLGADKGSINAIMIDAHIVQEQGVAKFRLYRAGSGSMDMSVNLNIDQVKNAVLAKETAVQQREMRIVNALRTVATKPPLMNLKALKKPESKPGLVPNNSFVNNLKPFGNIKIDPRTYSLRAFISNGKKYSIDEIIIGLNMLYHEQKLNKLSNDPRKKLGRFDFNNNSLLFKDDSGEIYLAIIDHSDEKYPAIFDKRFSIQKIKRQQISTLKSLIRKEELPYVVGFNEKQLEYHVYYDIMQRISPAFESIFREGDISCRSIYQCKDILSILNNEVPELSALLEKIKNKDRYFQYMHKYGGRADNYLVPLISLAPLPVAIPVGRFIASRPFLPKMDYYHEKHLWEQNYYYDAARRDGHVYKKPFYWSKLIRSNYTEYSFSDNHVRNIFQGGFSEGARQYANERLFDTVTSYFKIKKSNCSGPYAVPPVAFSTVHTRTLTDQYGSLKDSRSYESKVYIGRRFAEQYKKESEQIYPRDPTGKNRLYDKTTEEVASQMNRLVIDEGCKSPTVQHFEENLYRYFTGLPSLQKVKKRISGALDATENADDLGRIDSIYKSCMRNDYYGMDYRVGGSSKLDNKCACFERVAKNALANKGISSSDMNGYIANFDKFKALDLSKYVRGFYTPEYAACNSWR